MTGDRLSDSGPDARAQQSADRLALALEDIGFDVGRDLPMLTGATDNDGAPFVELGRVTLTVASGLSGVLERAVQRGVTLGAS